MRKYCPVSFFVNQNLKVDAESQKTVTEYFENKKFVLKIMLKVMEKMMF